jgi:tRNA (cytidine/uridine-2'-O-)-methyltransferase
VHIVLVHPEIAGNTGNIIRLCANVGATLHLVDPIGFSLEDRLLQRAGLDYHDLTNMVRHPDWTSCRDALPAVPRWALTSRASTTYTDADITVDDVIVYGCESVGLPDDVLADFDQDRQLRIPMRPNNRSLNLANSVALVAYDVWRRAKFDGAVDLT